MHEGYNWKKEGEPLSDDQLRTVTERAVEKVLREKPTPEFDAATVLYPEKAGEIEEHFSITNDDSTREEYGDHLSTSKGYKASIIDAGNREAKGNIFQALATDVAEEEAKEAFTLRDEAVVEQKNILQKIRKLEHEIRVRVLENKMNPMHGMVMDNDHNESFEQQLAELDTEIELLEHQYQGGAMVASVMENQYTEAVAKLARIVEQMNPTDPTLN